MCLGRGISSEEDLYELRKEWGNEEVRFQLREKPFSRQRYHDDSSKARGQLSEQQFALSLCIHVQ